MADIATGVRLYLMSNANVRNLVGDRIYTHILPQGALTPAVVLNKISTRHFHELSKLAGVASVRLQMDCYADNADDANATAEAIRESGILSFKGTTNGVDIRGARLEEGARYDIDEARDGSDDHRYITSFDLVVDYTETT